MIQLTLETRGDREVVVNPPRTIVSKPRSLPTVRAR